MSSILSQQGHLQLEEELGRGSYATVYKAKLTYTSNVAVKRIHRLLLDFARQSREDYEKVLRDFKRECDLLEIAKHPNIVRFIGVHEVDGEPALVMELLDQSLDEYIVDSKRKGGLPLTKQIDICTQIAHGLAFLHQFDPQILHRDLRTKNILVNIDCTLVKISDLGQAKFRPSDVNYLTTQAPGCILCMPPEALDEDNPKFTSKGDVFSFGVVMLEVGTQAGPSCGVQKIGSKPEIERRARDLSKLPNDHPLKLIILQCLRDNHKERPDIETVKVKLLMKYSLTAEPLKKAC